MNKKRKHLILLICAIFTLTAVPLGASAAVLYMPDVTAEMSSASYWSDKVSDPDKVLTSIEQIKELNQQIYAKSSGTRDLSKWSKTTFNGLEQNELTRSDLTASGRSYANADIGWWWDEINNKWSSRDAMGHIYKPIIENGIDPDATEVMQYKYAICTTRTCMRGFPTDYPMWDDPTDPDFDYLYHTMIRVNEPLLLLTRSADKNYYLALSQGISGWIPAADVAICKDREEWLDAWHTDDVLVVYDDKIYTEDSNIAPQTANRKLPMGTRLPLADESDIKGKINNRTAYNNHVVWMPVRNEDGTFKKELALIGENRKVSEGYLPLTTENIMKVAMNQLGDAYGWGGMLGSEDCSGYMRDIYACFGLDLPRSADRTRGVLKNWSLSGMSDEQKAAFIRQLPPGTILTFSGHEMMYLGQEGDNLYVISSISNIRLPGDKSNTRVRGAVINTLGLWRGDGQTWLHHLNYAEIPYYAPTQGMVITEETTPNGTLSADSTFPKAGETVTVSAAAERGYTIKKWTVTSGGSELSYEKAGEGQIQFTMPEEDVKVSAQFGPMHEAPSWADLQEKINAAAEGDAIQLTEDISPAERDTALVVGKGSDVVIDLNGHKIDRKLFGTAGASPQENGNVFTVQGALTIKDSSTKKTGTITGGYNTEKGGGVIIEAGGLLKMEGGSVEGNGVQTAEGAEAAAAGGVWLDPEGTLQMSGAPKIEKNQMTGGESAGESNLYLPEGQTIAIDGKLDADAVIAVTTQAAPAGTNSVVLTKGLVGNDGDASFLSDNENYLTGRNAQGEAILGVPVTVTFDMNGGAGEIDPIRVPAKGMVELPECPFEGPDGMIFKAWKVDGFQEPFAPPFSFDPWENKTVTAVWQDPWEALQEEINAAKSGPATVTLSRDIAGTDFVALVVDGGRDITLDLNGHTIDHGLSAPEVNGYSIVVNDGSRLTIVDSSAERTGTITGGYNQAGGGIYVYSGCSLALDGGTIAGNRAEKGSGVYVEKGGSLSISGAGFGKDDAIYLEDGVQIQVTGALGGDVRIPVETAAKPSKAAPVSLTAGLSLRGSIANFVSVDQNYRVTAGKDGEAFLAVKEQKVVKKANTLKAKGKTVKLKAKKLKKKKQTITRKRAITIKNAKGEVTYTKVKVNKKKYAKKFTINKKTGKITVKKGVKKGLYKVTVRVKAAGNGSYLPASKKVVVKIRVK